VDIPHVQKIREAQRIQQPGHADPSRKPAAKNGASFRDLLSQEQEQIASEVKLSAHAQHRIQQRHIPMTVQDMEQLNQAILKAEAKGARESLVLMQNKGFIVSVPTKTVITAIDQAQMRDNIFTNIDSTIIV